MGHGTKVRRKLSHQFSTAGRQPATGKYSHCSTYRLFHRLGRICHGDMCGTAGQQGLTLLNTTINCPTKVSPFWDELDTLGRGQNRRKPSPVGSVSRLRCAAEYYGRQPRNFFLGHGTKLRHRPGRFPKYDLSMDIKRLKFQPVSPDLPPFRGRPEVLNSTQ